MGLLAIGGGLLFVYICTSKTLKDIYEIMLLETEIEYGREGLIMDHSSDDKKYLDFYKKVFVKRKCMSYIPIVNLIVAKKNTDQIKDEFQSFFASDSSGIIKLSRIQANMIDSAETFEEAYSMEVTG